MAMEPINAQEVEQAIQQLQKVIEDFTAGHESFRAALGLSDEDIVALTLLAGQLAEQGQLDNAQTLLEGLIAIEPQEGYLHTALGCVYMQKDLSDAALYEFRVAVDFNPDDIVAHTYAGELYLERGDLENALIHLQRAVELDPDGTNPYGNRARALTLLVATIAKEVQEKGPEAAKALIQAAQQGTASSAESVSAHEASDEESSSEPV